MRLKDKRDQRTIEPSRFALGIPAMDKRNDALGSRPHEQVGVNTGDLKLVSMTNGDYINSRIGGHSSTFSKKQLYDILHATPSAPGETGNDDEPPVELNGTVEGGVEKEGSGGGGDGEGESGEGESAEGESGEGESGEGSSGEGGALVTIKDVNEALKDVTGAVSSRVVWEKMGELYSSSNTGVFLRESTNGAKIFIGGVPLLNATVSKLEMAVKNLNKLNEEAKGKAKERITSDLRKLTKTLKSKKLLASKPGDDGYVEDDEEESKPRSKPKKMKKVKETSNAVAVEGGSQ
jgi:hypothetical protein